jgi:hypothetical protein
MQPLFQPPVAQTTDYWGMVDPALGSTLPKEILSQSKATTLVVFSNCLSCTIQPDPELAIGGDRKDVVNIAPISQKAAFERLRNGRSEVVILYVSKATLDALNPSFQPRVYGYNLKGGLVFIQQKPGRLEDVLNECYCSLVR